MEIRKTGKKSQREGNRWDKEERGGKEGEDERKKEEDMRNESDLKRKWSETRKMLRKMLFD